MKEKTDPIRRTELNPGERERHAVLGVLLLVCGLLLLFFFDLPFIRFRSDTVWFALWQIVCFGCRVALCLTFLFAAVYQIIGVQTVTCPRCGAENRMFVYGKKLRCKACASVVRIR